MSMLVTTCPHCSAENIAMKVWGIDYSRPDSVVNVFTACPKCRAPSCHEIWSTRGGADRSWFSTSEASASTTEILSKTRWDIKKTYPEPASKAAPEATPPHVERIFAQARSTHQRAELDAAAMLYRKTLETAVKELDAGGKGSLDARIKTLSKSDMIPEAVATWAHEIRGIGNDAAHDADEPSQDDVDAAAEFVEAFLTYAFTMPAKISNRLSKTATAKLG